MNKYLLLVDKKNTIQKYRIKGIKEGVISTYCKKKIFSLEVAKVYFSKKCTYYVVGEIEPQLQAGLEHAQNLFKKNRFFRSLMRDKMTLVELILLGAVIISMILNFQFYQKIDALLKIIQVVS